jgi:hypothetical protein
MKTSKFNFLDPKTLLPNASARIQVHRYRHANHLARAILDAVDADPSTQLIGISISQGHKGAVEFVAFATVYTVYILNATPDSGKSSSSAHSSSLPHENAFKELLAGKDGRSIFVAGFDMPRLALRLYNHFGFHVRGTDLSTVCSPSRTEAWLPAKIASAKLGTLEDMEKFRIDRLWHENNDSEENLCLRAWMSAMCVVYL